MQNKRPRTLALTLALAAVAVEASALGFGPVSSSTVLGQPLDHAIALRLDGGEMLAPECVSAEVAIGDFRVPALAVSARLESDGGGVVLRVRTAVAVDEPVVSVSVSLGCPPRLSRRFTLLADPPAADMPSAPLTVAADRLPPAAPAEAPPEARPAAQTPLPEPRAAAAPPRAASAAVPAPRRAPPRRVTAGEPASTATAPAGRPRLRLDPVDLPEVREARARAAELAASAAAAIASANASVLASAEAASAAAQRVAELEKTVAAMRAEAAADREALRALRQRQAGSDAAARWMPALALATLLLALLAGWLALKLRRLQAERQQQWWNAASAASTPQDAAAAATVAETVAATAAPSTAAPAITRPGALGPVFEPAADEPEVPPSAGERTQALPVGWREEPEPTRDVSIEELIDLEQQAEFFSVLGQEEAAIDLLVDYLRNTGGGTPMPYLKLLEIYRRRGDREAYERTRARFNHRFNAYAPDWDTDPGAGRSLEDYPAIVARLQMAWPSPIDAMAELESLLFRKTRGELFDLPAYRDVLFLYSLARDLLDHEPLETGRVDVLLPISDGSEFTQPMSLADSPAALDASEVPLDNPPTVPVDLDVTQPQMPDSLFGDNDPSRRRR